MSILIIIYLLFLLTFVTIMTIAVSRVWFYSVHKELIGKSIAISLLFVFFSIVIIIFTFFGIFQYTWDDSASFYIDRMSSGFQNIHRKEPDIVPVQETSNVKTSDETTKDQSNNFALPHISQTKSKDGFIEYDFAQFILPKDF